RWLIRQGKDRGGFNPPGYGSFGGSKSDSIDPYRASNVFEALVAQILERQIESVANVVAHCARHANSARFGQGFQPSRHIHTVAVDVAILDDDIAQIDADPKYHPLFLGYAVIALCHAALHRHRTSDGLYNAWEFDQYAVAGRFDGAASVLVDLWIDQFALM